MEAMHHEVNNFWLDWQIAPELLIPLILITYMYRRNFGGNQNAKYFYAGIFSAVAVIQTPIGTNAMNFFWCHMVQHMVLMMLTGPLLVMGTPSGFFPRGFIKKVFELLINPWLSWFLYAGLMIGVHLTPIHSFIMNNGWMHSYVEVPLYFLIAYCFYFSILERDGVARRMSPAIAIFSLFFMMVPETLTGFFIYVSPGSVYENMYTLNDQRRGGSLMWAGSMILDAIWISIAVSHWIKSEERKALEMDAENG